MIYNLFSCSPNIPWPFYCAGKPIERVVYCLIERENVEVMFLLLYWRQATQARELDMITLGWKLCETLLKSRLNARNWRENQVDIQLQKVQILTSIWTPPRDRAPITWQIGTRRTNHDREFCYRYSLLALKRTFFNTQRFSTDVVLILRRKFFV